MIEIGPARESEVVLAFLKAEIDHSDHRQGIQQNLAALGYTRLELIDEADLSNDYENAIRAVLLDSYRGYLSRGALFIGFPKKISWSRVELEPADLDRLRYISNEKNWDSYSDGTQQPQRVVDKIARGELPEAFSSKVGAIRESLRRGVTLPEIVAVEGEENTLVLIEGAHRTTAYVSLQWKANVPAIVGSSPLMRNWHWYGPQDKK